MSGITNMTKRVYEQISPMNLIGLAPQAGALALVRRLLRDGSAVAVLSQDTDIPRLHGASPCRMQERHDHNIKTQIKSNAEKDLPIRLSSKDAPLNRRPLLVSCSLKPLPVFVHLPHMLSRTCKQPPSKTRSSRSVQPHPKPW
eukprot:1383993-Rhodomonas_salina.1